LNKRLKSSLNDEEDESSYRFFLKMMPGVEEKHLAMTRANDVFRREVEANFR